MLGGCLWLQEPTRFEAKAYTPGLRVHIFASAQGRRQESRACQIRGLVIVFLTLP